MSHGKRDKEYDDGRGDPEGEVDSEKLHTETHEPDPQGPAEGEDGVLTADDNATLVALDRHGHSQAAKGAVDGHDGLGIGRQQRGLDAREHDHRRQQHDDEQHERDGRHGEHFEQERRLGGAASVEEGASVDGREAEPVEESHRCKEDGVGGERVEQGGRDEVFPDGDGRDP